MALVVAAVLAVLLLVSLAAAPARAAGSVTFGDPSATATFGTGITFSQPVRAPDVQARYVEILISRPGSPGPEVYPIAQTGDISTATFEYNLGEDTQHIFPNTRITARWRVTDTAGTVSLGPQASVTYADTRFSWQVVTGALVRVHWYKGDQGFGQRALAIGEAGVAKAEQLLGVTETEPIDFYVYADLAAFYGALGPGTRENVGGEALPDIRTLFALITPDQINESWVGIVIPHELTHLVFDTTVHNPYHFPPHWLNEGLAVYLSQGFDATDRGLVRSAIAARDLIPLPGLDGQFPTRRDKFTLAYAESVSAIDFMIRTYGRDALVRLITSYAGGITDDAAFSGALGVDVAMFNSAWLTDIGARPPDPQGPRPDPAGPLPSGWSSSPAPAPVQIPPVLASPALSPTASAGDSPAETAGGTPSAPPPTLTGGATSPVGTSSTAASGGTGPAGSAAPTVTPGVIATLPAGTQTSSIGTAWLLGVGALVSAALGIGLLAARRRSPESR